MPPQDLPRQSNPSETRTPDFVSVIVPMHNAEETIAEQLDALLDQSYPDPYEIIVVNNRSTDGCPKIVDRYQEQEERLRLIDAPEVPSAGFARNTGASAASGDLLAFCDADDVVDRTWLAELVRGAAQHDAVGGSRDAQKLNDSTLAASVEPGRNGLPRSVPGLPRYAVSSNLAVWREAFEAVEGFPVYEGAAGDDVVFSWRLQLAGYDLGYTPAAVVHMRLRRSVRDAWRQSYKYGVARARNYRDFRHLGGRRRSLVRAVAIWAKLLVRSVDLARAPHHRRRWLRAVAYEFGCVAGAIRYRVIFFG